MDFPRASGDGFPARLRRDPTAPPFRHACRGVAAIAAKPPCRRPAGAAAAGSSCSCARTDTAGPTQENKMRQTTRTTLLATGLMLVAGAGFAQGTMQGTQGHGTSTPAAQQRPAAATPAPQATAPVTTPAPQAARPATPANPGGTTAGTAPRPATPPAAPQAATPAAPAPARTN
jgi:hypothetical protein